MNCLNAEFLKQRKTLRKENFKATILVDMDEVIADLIPEWFSLYNKLFNDNITIKIATEWDTAKIVKPECGTKIYELLKTPGLFRYLKPKPHSQEVIQRLIDNGFEIVIVSDSPMGHSHSEFSVEQFKFGNPTDDKRAWLQENFPMIPSKNVVFTSQKWRVYGDILIDDKPETYEIFEQLNRKVILIDQPYNKYINSNFRTKNLLEAEKIIYSLFI